jgi:3-dehydroquinate synthase
MTERIEQTFAVRYRYDVYMTQDAFAPANATLAQVLASGADRARVLIVLDGGLAQAQPSLAGAIERYAEAHALDRTGPIIEIGGGEAAKNDTDALFRLHRAIEQARLCRHSYIVAVGGGAVLDVAGFAAATAHRGIRLVRLPSTVLAQCDAGVGVKNGINAFGKKNFLGTFAPPYAVINDISLLRTLHDRDWRAGMAEAVKVALIKDATFFDFLEAAADDLARRDAALMQRLIHRCAELHLAHIAQGGDPFEQGSARPLDFGHWAAHKLEQLTDYRLRHGEAVAIGIALDAAYSHLSGFLSRRALERILATLACLGFELYVDELSANWDRPGDRRCLLTGLDEFREHLGGSLCVTQLADIGRGFEVQAMDPARIRAAVDWLRDVAAARRPCGLKLVRGG